MNEQYSSAGFIILGSILALIVSVLVETLKVVRENYSQRKNTKISLKLEIKNALNLVDRISEAYSSKHFFEVKSLDQFQNSLNRLEDMKNSVIYLRENDKKEEVLGYINSLSIFVSDLRATETNAFSQQFNPLKDTGGNIQKDAAGNILSDWNSDYYKSERQMLIIKSVDIKRRGQDILTYLEK